MSRSIKAIKLLHLLKDSSKKDNKYVKVSKILKVLNTDDRNVRRIVTLLNENLNINIESRSGRDGGYCLGNDIYSYFLGVSNIELNSLNTLKSALSRLDDLSLKESEAILVLDKLTNSTEIEEETSYVSHIIYEEDESEDDFIIL